MNIVWECDAEDVKVITIDKWYTDASIICFILVILLNLLKL